MANTKWEYKNEQTLSPMDESDLNEYGIGGWELVNMSSSLTAFHYTFKRPIMDSVLSGIMQADRRLLEAYAEFLSNETGLAYDFKDKVRSFLASNGA